jgi:hypothetical protein
MVWSGTTPIDLGIDSATYAINRAGLVEVSMTLVCVAPDLLSADNQLAYRDCPEGWH